MDVAELYSYVNRALLVVSPLSYGQLWALDTASSE
jgi:hypothetical protein